MENITSIVDKYLDYVVDNEINSIVGKVEPEMLAPNQDPNEEWQSWLPIKSKATDKEIMDFEKTLGYGLPDSYKTFLKHKHFYELYIDQAEFCSHPVNIWRASLSDMIFDGWPRELLIDKGYVPFSNWSDWGMLCFDTTTKSQDNNYPVVLWDHDGDFFTPFADNFEKLLIRLDEEAIKNRN